MAYPVYTAADLATFSGRPESEYTAYADQALLQATLLFKIGTCRAEPPAEGLGWDLMKFAILAMADAIVLSQPHQKVLANPFNSETIGSYSYSKTAGAVAAAQPTGIMWFDMAMKELSLCSLSNGLVPGGAIEVFEDDGPGVFTQGAHPGNLRFLSPEDLEFSAQMGYDPYGNASYGIKKIYSESDLEGFEQDGGLLGEDL
jgi:hypothetical protein